MSGWPLQLVTSLICLECLFCISLPCNQTYEAKNGHMCYPCSRGYYTVSDCVSDGDQARCRRCGNGKYQPNCDNSPKCASCRPFCPPGQVKVKACDAISDIKCQCKTGSYWKADEEWPEEGHCQPHSTCRPGEGRVKTGTPFEDTRCEPCREGVSYSDNSSLDSCKPCTVCNTSVIVNCIASHDTVCSDIDYQCKNGSFWKSDAEKSKEGHCQSHSKCRPGEGRVQKGTPFEDTRCEPCREGVSYSDSSSLDSCIPCTVCNTSVIVNCTAVQDTVCSNDFPKRPLHTKNSSKGLDDGAIAGIVTGCTVFLLLAVALVLALICRFRLKHGLSSNTESPNLQVNGENGLAKSNSETQSGVAINKTETPGGMIYENDHSDENEEGSVKSYATLKQSQHEFENEAFDSQSFTEFKTHEESENNVIQNAQEAKCYPSLQTTGYTSTMNTHLVNDNDPNTYLDFSDIQTESSDENLKEEDANEQMQYPDKSQSCNKNALPTVPVTNIDTPSEKIIIFSYEENKDDKLKINHGEETIVSIDAAAMSPRDSRGCGGPNREVVSEESMIKETESGIRSQIDGNSEDHGGEKTVWSDDSIRRVWFEIMAFISQNLQWGDFQLFMMHLVANTNNELLKTIDVVINHAKEENKSIKNAIYCVMNTWIQATPEATVHCVYNALNEYSLKLQCEKLEKTLVQKGLVDRMNSSFQYMARENDETAQKHYLSPGETSAQNHREITPEMDVLKEENSEIFC